MTKNGRVIFNLSTFLAFFTILGLLFAADHSKGIISLEGRGKPKEASVVFYNVENLFDTINDPEKNDEEFTPEGKNAWNSQRYNHKLSQLATVLAGSSEELPALIGLAEVENDAVLRDLIAQEALSGGGYEIIHFGSLDERGIDVALLYRKKIFKPDHMETFYVNLGHGERPTRDILYVNGHFKGGPLLHVFVNHWPSRYGGQEQSEPKRKMAATVLRTAIDEILTENSNASILAMGDFNDYPTNISLTEVLSAKSDTESGLLVNLMKDKEAELRGSYNYRGEWGFLDQIIVSRSMYEGGLIMVKPGSAAPHFTDEMMFTDPKYGDIKPSRTYGGPNYYGGFSDHLPVKAVLLY